MTPTITTNAKGATWAPADPLPSDGPVIIHTPRFSPNVKPEDLGLATCERCGAAVLPDAREIHEAWHRSLEASAHRGPNVESLQAYADAICTPGAE